MVAAATPGGDGSREVEDEKGKGGSAYTWAIRRALV
jgi:hypothetical protein